MKKAYFLGGGTFFHVRNHFSLAATAFGGTARQLYDMACADNNWNTLEKRLVLTRMANPSSTIETNQDVREFVNYIRQDVNTKIIFFSAAMCDWESKIGGVTSSKKAKRLVSSNEVPLILQPANKVIHEVRKYRKDIFLVGFKATTDFSEKMQYASALNLLKKASCNLVFANDTKGRNMIVTPEEAKYTVTSNRREALEELLEMTRLRSHLTFTRSTVVAGDPVPWDSPMVFPALRKVVNHCIERNAYKPFNGATVGHFACKVSDKEFLTSIRKSNFNNLEKNGLVRIVTDGPDTVIAYGAKPSVGGQSQRIIFSDHADKEYNCIVHFHCPRKPDSKVPVVSQKEYECGSHECGKNTSNGLQQFGNLSAVMLDNHGPNIVFNNNIDPQEVIDFIETNFDLEEKTSGVF